MIWFADNGKPETVTDVGKTNEFLKQFMDIDKILFELNNDIYALALEQGLIDEGQYPLPPYSWLLNILFNSSKKENKK